VRKKKNGIKAEKVEVFDVVASIIWGSENRSGLQLALGSRLL
jgi:hypothetical protein